MTKVKVLRAFPGQDRYFEVDEVVDFNHSFALDRIEQGYVEEVKEGLKESPTPPREPSEGPALSIPVKSGGANWFDVALWPPRPNAPEQWKHRAGVTVAKKFQNQQTKKVETTEDMHLTPSQAVSVGSVLQAIGFEGKKLDRDG